MNVKKRPQGLAHFESIVRDFSETVANARDRTKALEAPLTGPSGDLVQDPHSLRAALEELRVHQEELTVADEEMRAQVDELARTSARAATERDRYRELFHLAPDGQFVTDRYGIIRDANASALKILAIEGRFLLGKPLASFVDAADRRLLRDTIEDLRTKPDMEIALRLLPREGAAAWHTLRGVVIQAGTAVLWVARNVDPQHAREAELRGSNDALHAEAKTSYADLVRANADKDDLLARERGLRAQLEDAHTAKDRFLAVLSHDLRAPLNAVLGWTQLLRREPLDQHTRGRALATIERNARAQLRLIEELLDISRIGAGKVQLQRTPLDLGEVVRRAADSITLAAREAEVALSVTTPDGRMLMSGDRRRIEQVMTNLLSNALKFTPAGGRIVVSLERDGGSAKLVVEDTGRGIAADLLPTVFDPFKQAGDYTTMMGGIGLGLYIVRQAAELHGGTVHVESEGQGRGARFTLLLPLLDAPVPSAGRVPPAPTSEMRLPSANDLEGVRVLVVDDEEDARDLMATVLRQRGAIVAVASDVMSALGSFDENAVDVVVSDIGMPGQSGLDLVRALRDERATSAAFVAVTGYATPEEVAAAFSAGFDIHVAKPIDPSELAAVVRDAARAR